MSEELTDFGCPHFGGVPLTVKQDVLSNPVEVGLFGAIAIMAFYISTVYYFGNEASNAMIYWKEGRALILWEPRSFGTDRRHELVWSKRFLSLDKDVVPTLTDVGGSNYLVTRQWARQVIRDCVRNGEKFVLYQPSRRYRAAQSNELKRLQLTAR